MKKVLTLLFSIIALLASAQKKGDYKATITSTINHYNTFAQAKNVDSLLNFMYPKFFTLFPKEDLANGMKRVFNDTTISMSFSNLNVKSISKVYTLNKVQYALLNYTMDLSIAFNSEEAKSNALFATTLKNTYSTIYGAENVSYNEDTHAFTIKAKNAMFCINDPAYGERWWFVEKKDDLRSMTGDIIPAKVWDKFTVKKK